MPEQAFHMQYGPLEPVIEQLRSERRDAEAKVASALQDGEEDEFAYNEGRASGLARAIYLLENLSR